MKHRLRTWISRLIVWPLALIGVAALVVAALVAVPVEKPHVNQEIQDAVAELDRSGLPGVSRFQARDGTELAYRFYPAEGANRDTVVVTVHGSGGNSTAMNALAKALSAEGIAVAAPDIRGHGYSGNRGDIGYIGQLEDDLEDLLDQVRKRTPDARLVLLGHSSGGGFALRAANAPVGKAFERIVLLAPFLGPFSPTTRDPEGEDAWAAPDIPRIIALNLLRQLGLTCCEALPAIAFALPADDARFATRGYSYRLLVNFGPPEDYRAAFAEAAAPVTVLAGDGDTLMVSTKYAEVVEGLEPKTEVAVVSGVDHMGIIYDPAALADVVSAVKGE